MKTAGIIALTAVLLAACGHENTSTLPGYVEAEYTRIAAPLAGRLVALQVEKGAQVAAGAPLFVLDAESEKASVDEAKARLKRSAAQVADLAKGKRQDEIAVQEAQLAAAQASLAQSRSDLQRQSELAKSGFISGANLQGLQTRVDADAAKVREVSALLKVAQLAARSDQRVAAEADQAAAQAQLAQSQWRVDQKVLRAPVTARVDETLYRVGEWVPAGMPVVNLLAPDAIKIRFFVPQELLSIYRLGRRLQVRCDGCAPLVAKISFIAPQAEFTPPVIYSKENRARLVFMLEAKPEASATLAPGQPVDVELLP